MTSFTNFNHKEAAMATITTNIPTTITIPSTIEGILADAQASRRVRRWAALGFSTREIASHLNITIPQARALLRAL